MYWFERTILLSSRFVFSKYHNCVIGGSLGDTRLRHHAYFLLPLSYLINVWKQFICILYPARALTFTLRYLAQKLSVIITHLPYVAEILFRALVFTFWASVVQPHFIYLEPVLPPIEGFPLGLALVAGYYVSRLLKHISCLETRSVPCLYPPFSIVLSDLYSVLHYPFASNWPTHPLLVLLRSYQAVCLSFVWFLVKHPTHSLEVRVSLILGTFYLCVSLSVACIVTVRSLEEQ